MWCSFIHNFGERSYFLIALLIIVAFGSFLRLYGLANQSFWNDELSTWLRSDYSNVQKVIEEGVRPDVHPPGYQLIIYYWKTVTGDSEWALRFPSAITGIITILVIFSMGTFLFSFKEGLIATALMAASWTSIYYSQEARPYSLLLLFSSLSALAWFKIISDFKHMQKMKWYSILAYVLAATALCYVHYYGVLLVFLQGIYLLFIFALDYAKFMRITLIYLVILVLYSPWLPEFFTDLSVSSSYINKPTLRSLLLLWGFLFSYSYILSGIAVLSCGFLLWRQIKKIKKPIGTAIRKHLSDPTMTLLLWLIVPVIFVFFKSLISTPVFTPRNFIICLPPAYLLLARSLVILPLFNKISTFQVSIVSLLIFCSLAIHVIWGMKYYNSIHKEQFREAVSYVVKKEYDYPNAIIFGCVWNTRYLEYYFKYFDSPRKVLGPVQNCKEIPFVNKTLDEISPDFIWYISAHRRSTEDCLDYFSKKFRLLESKEFIGAHVRLYAVN